MRGPKIRHTLQEPLVFKVGYWSRVYTGPHGRLVKVVHGRPDWRCTLGQGNPLLRLADAWKPVLLRTE